jgi:hypothetical protein
LVVPSFSFVCICTSLSSDRSAVLVICTVCELCSCSGSGTELTVVV